MQSLPRVVGPYTLFNLCQRLKSSPVFSDHVIVKLSCDQTGSSQNGGLTFVTIRNSSRLSPGEKTSSDMNVLIWLKCWLFGQGCEEEEKIILSPNK